MANERGREGEGEMWSTREKTMYKVGAAAAAARAGARLRAFNALGRQ